MGRQSTEHTPDSKDEQESKLSSLDATTLALRIAIEQKGLDARGIDLRSITDISDYFAIVSGTSERHVQGIAEKIKVELKSLGEQPISLSGLDRGEWVLLDYGDFVVHVFYEPVRQYYRFDELWKNGPDIKLSPELEEQVRKLRTGMYY